MPLTEKLATAQNVTNPNTRRGDISVGALGAATVVANETFDGIWHRTRLTCTALSISVADDAGVAQYGGALVYTFPEGLIFLAGAVIDGGMTVLSGTIIAAFTGVVALGSSTASTGASLVSGEATWLQSTAMATASSSVNTCDAVSIATQLTETSSRVFDGTGTTAKMYLNIAIADDATHTAAVLTFTGTIEFLWAVIGDL